MHTISRTKLVAHRGGTKWHGTLATSVVSWLAAVRPTCLRYPRVRKQSQACETDRVAARLACPGVMLVESDVCQHICGIVP
jgi:hypothetical protein